MPHKAHRRRSGEAVGSPPRESTSSGSLRSTASSLHMSMSTPSTHGRDLEQVPAAVPRSPDPNSGHR